MISADREATGQRIARARRRRGLSQAVLAGLVGRSESWLSQVERGKRGVDSRSVLVRLAEVLRVDIEELLGSADGDEPDRRVHPAASLIEQAMMAYGVPTASTERERPDREVSLDYLRAKARSVYQSYQATRYDATGRILPELISDVETVAQRVGTASPVACGVRVLVYDTAAALLSRVGEQFLAWAAADRARSAAEYAGDPLLVAVSAWRLSYMITGRKHPQEALGLAMTAAAALERAMRTSSPEQLSVYGALHLAAATAAAACYDRTTTEAALAKARGIADHTGETNHMGTAFGPVNVAIHAIATSLKLGARSRRPARRSSGQAHAGRPRPGPRVRHEPEGRGRGQPPAGRGAAQSPVGPLRPGDPGRPHRTAAPRTPTVHTGTATSGTSRGRNLTRTFMRVPGPHPHPASLPSGRCGVFSPVLPSLVAGQDPANARRSEVEERVPLSLRLASDEWDQLWRLGEFRQRHPGVVIGAGEGWWQARIPEPNGEIVTTRYTLRALPPK